MGDKDAQDKDKEEASGHERVDGQHEFWKTHSSADYWDETEEVKVEVRKRPRRPVSVKLSKEDIKALKRIARRKGWAT